MSAVSYINNSILDEPIPEIDVPIMRFTHPPVHPKISSVWLFENKRLIKPLLVVRVGQGTNPKYGSH